jgi:hypothetical protein
MLTGFNGGFLVAAERAGKTKHKARNKIERLAFILYCCMTAEY